MPRSLMVNVIWVKKFNMFFVFEARMENKWKGGSKIERKIFDK